MGKKVGGAIWDPLRWSVSRSRPTNGDSAGNDPIYESRNRLVHFRARADGVFMGRRGVAQYPYDLVLGKQLVVVYRKQKRLANRKGRHAGMICFVGQRGRSSL